MLWRERIKMLNKILEKEKANENSTARVISKMLDFGKPKVLKLNENFGCPYANEKDCYINFKHCKMNYEKCLIFNDRAKEAFLDAIIV